MFVQFAKCSYFEGVHGLSVDFIYPQSSSRVLELVKKGYIIVNYKVANKVYNEISVRLLKEINMKQFDIHDWFNYIIFQAQGN